MKPLFNLLLIAMFLSTGIVFAKNASVVADKPPVLQYPKEEILMLPIGGSLAATNLHGEGKCSETKPGTTLIKLSWNVVEDSDRNQRVDLTMFREGFKFRKVKTQTTQVLSPTQSFLELEGLDAGINYYWRVLTRTRKGWIPSETARLEVPICPIDMELPPLEVLQ